MILCCSSIGARQKNAVGALEKVAQAGFKHAELWQNHLLECLEKDPEEIQSHLARLDLSLPIVSPFTSFTQGETRWNESLRLIDRCAAFAKKVGAHSIRFFTDVGPSGIGSAQATEAHWKAAVAGLQQAADCHPDLAFIVETHEWTLADSVASTLRLMQETKRSNVGLIFQPIRPFLGEGLLRAWDDLRPHIRHSHWQQMTAEGESTYLDEAGVIDFAALAQHMKNRGYQGSVSIEHCWPNPDIARLPQAFKLASAWLHS